MNKKINIDIWRFIVSFLIIAIHISPFEKISVEFDFFFTRILGRIAVPLFLMITGYYILDKALNDITKLKEYTKKIIKIYLFCILLYLPVNIYMGMFKDFNFISYFKNIFIDGTMYHLWYFPALILGIWFTYFLINKLGNKKTLILVIILYIVGLLGDSYYGIIIHNKILTNIYDVIFKIFDYTRNGLFYVPIFIYLGYLIKTTNYYNKKDWLYSLLLFISMSLEGLILHYFNLQKHDSMYIFLIPFMYFLFRYLINNNIGSNKKIRNIATNMYIFHPLFIVLIRFISGIIGLKDILIKNNLILYLVVCISTVLFSILFEKVKEVVKNERIKFRKRSCLD